MRTLITAIILLLAITTTAAADNGPDCNPCDNYSLTLANVTETAPGVYRWTYHLSITGGKDVSHVTVSVPSCYEVIAAGPGVTEIGYDPTTGVTGVKWDSGFDSPGEYDLWFDAKGDNRIGDSTGAVKAGTDVCRYEVQGPVCAPNAVQVTDIEAKQISNDWLRLIAIVAIGAIFGRIIGLLISRRRM